MIFSPRRLATAFLALVFAAGSAAAAGKPCPESAQRFWSAFRHAALAKGAAEVSRYARTPFQLAGPLDSSERREIDRKGFVAIFPRLLATDPGLSPEPTTMRRHLKKTLTLPERACNESNDQFRVGTWVFQLTPEGWKFVRAYIDE